MVPHKPVYSARSPDRSVSPKTWHQARYLRSRPARISASSLSRSRLAAPSRRSEVAASPPGPGGGSSAGPVDTLTPTPTTTASPAASARIPPSFLGGTTLLSLPPATADPDPPARVFPGPASTSFGHFSCASTPDTSRTASATATPASSGSQPRRARGTASGRSSTEKVRAARGGDTQVRPSRPRPAVCCSAASTAPSGSPSAARASRSALVDPVTAVTSTVRHSPPGRIAAARTAAASRGASVTDANAQAAEALALALDLDHLDPADGCGRGHVGAAVGLLVQAHDVD